MWKAFNQHQSEGGHQHKMPSINKHFLCSCSTTVFRSVGIPAPTTTGFPFVGDRLRLLISCDKKAHEVFVHANIQITFYSIFEGESSFSFVSTVQFDGSR
jgi:hypothetical protein